MGSTFSFVCDKCGYEANVSGGKDHGFISSTQTMVCHDCDELCDVLIWFLGMEKGQKEHARDYGEEWIDLFKDQTVLELINAKNRGIKPKKNHCPICGNVIDKAVVFDFGIRDGKPEPCFKCKTEIQDRVYKNWLLYLEYRSMIHNAKDRGIKPKKGHCPICGNVMDKAIVFNFTTKEEKLEPCLECKSEIRDSVEKGLLTEWDYLNVCRECLGKNVTLWRFSEKDSTGPCPKCNGNMKKGEQVAFWD